MSEKTELELLRQELLETKESFAKLSKSVEKIAPIIESLGLLLVPRHTVNERAGLNKNTLAQNSNVGKFEQLGKRATLIQIADVSVIKKRAKGTRKRTSSTVK